MLAMPEDALRLHEAAEYRGVKSAMASNRIAQDLFCASLVMHAQALRCITVVQIVSLQ